MRTNNWWGIASVVMATLGTCYFINTEGRGAEVAYSAPAPAQQPLPSIDEALAIARKRVETEKIDVSKHHISSAVLDMNPRRVRRNRGPFWAIRWDRDAQSGIVEKGYFFVVQVHMDKSTEIVAGM